MTKRKANNELERTKRVARASLKDCVVVYVSGDTHKRLYSLKHSAQVRCTSNIDRAIHAIRWPWTVYIAAFCRDQSGAEYVKAEEVAVAGEYFYGELADMLNEQHFALLDTVNKHHLCGVGWIAAPRRCTFDEHEAFGVFVNNGAFELLANWQAEGVA
jgi:hypothetical protein